MTTPTTTASVFDVVDAAFSAAIQTLDKQCGLGYAKKNPQLLASLTKIILDVSMNDCVASEEEVEEFFGKIK